MSSVKRSASTWKHSASGTLLDLPSEIFISIFEYLPVDALSKLSRTCRGMHDMVTKFGWAAYLRLHRQPACSLSCTDALWSAFERVRYDVTADAAWAARRFVARPLAPPWPGKLLPVLALAPSRLVVAAGSSLYVYAFTPPHSSSPAPGRAGASPGMRSEVTYVVRRPGERADARQDITGVVFVPDGGADRTLCAGFADGAVMRITLPDKLVRDAAGVLTSAPVLEELYAGDGVIEGLAASGSLTLSLSAGGTARLQDLSAAAPASFSTLQLSARSWSAHLCTTASTPYAAFGTSSATPLALHALTAAQLAPAPHAVLGSAQLAADNAHARTSAVYGLCSAPPAFPSAPRDVLVTGWYDGVVRVYDLRASQRLAGGVRAPVLSLCDPWSFEPVYAVSAGGAAGSTVAAGSARHSVVAFWDVRRPRAGWSVHAPGNDSSPVYSAVLESSRLFGATQSRAFVYDFGSGVDADTYPPIPPSRANNAPKKFTSGVGYYVTTYQHSRD